MPPHIRSSRGNGWFALDGDGSWVRPEWSLELRVPPSRLTGANGIRFGSDGKLFVAQFLGSTINAIDTATGDVQPMDLHGCRFVAPDDLVFDDRDALFATEVMDGLVSVRLPGGNTTVLADNLRGVNGIAMRAGRLFVNEFRPGGRVLELYTNGRAPRVITSDVPMPNAMSVGSDGCCYIPAVADGEIWRVHPDDGRCERVAAGLAMPTAVKFDPSGRLVVTQAASGTVSRIDVTAGTTTAVSQLRPGIDNLDFDSEGRLFVAHFIDGGISEVRMDGSEREVVRRGLLGPWGLAADSSGVVYIADGMSLIAADPDGNRHLIASFCTNSFPGFLRSVTQMGDGALVVATSGGCIARLNSDGQWTILARDLDQITGIVAGHNDEVIVCECGSGTLLALGRHGITTVATNLGRPMGVARANEGGYYVADGRGGRIVEVIGPDQARTIVTGLQEPHGIDTAGGFCFIVDRGSKQVLGMSVHDHRIEIIAAQLPIGTPNGICVPVLPGTDVLPGPLLPFVGLACDRNQTVFVSGDGDGSVLALHNVNRNYAQ